MNKTIKKVLIIVFLLLMIYICSPKEKTNATNNNDMNNDDYYYKTEEKVLQEIKSTTTIIDDETWNIYDQTYFNRYDIVLNGITKKYFVFQDKLYILFQDSGNSYLKKVNLLDNSEKEVLILGTLYDMVFYNDVLYIIGSIDDDAIIYMYNLELDYLTKYQYGGEKNEFFTNIKIINDSIYLFGLKDAISKDSPFANVGNTEEIKPFVVKLNKKMKIEKGFYINEGTPREEITSLLTKDKYMYFIIRTDDDKYYQYILNQNLEVVEKYPLNFYDNISQITLLDTKTIKDEKIYVCQSGDKLYYIIFTNQIHYSYLIKENVQNIYFCQIKNGKLDIYYSADKMMKNIKISEYHILYLSEKQVYYQDTNYNSTSHFLVKSYFEDLRFVYDEELNEHIKLNQSQITNATYSALSESGEKIIIQTPYRVHPYINIINNGLYTKGYTMLFSDDVYLNGEKIYNGEVLSQNGIYEVVQVINQKNGEQTRNNYTIYVYDEYYKDFNINYLHSMIDLNPGEEYYYEIKLSNNKQVREIIIDNETYPFIQNNEIVSVCFKAADCCMIEEYHLDKLVFQDNTELSLDDTIKIRTKKQAPTIDIYYQEENIIYNIDDKDKTIVDVKVKYYQDNLLIKEEMTYLNPYKIVLPTQKTEVEIYLLYDDGTVDIKEELIFELEGLSDKKEKNIFQINYNISDTVKQISFSNFDSNKTTINASSILGMSLSNIFVKEDNSWFINIVIFSTSILLVVTTFLVAYKKHKK